MRTETTYLNGIPVHSIIYEESDYSTEEQKQTWLNECNKCHYKQNEICGHCGCLLEQIMFYYDAKCPNNVW